MTVNIANYLDMFEVVSSADLRALGNQSPTLATYQKFWLDKSCEGQVMLYAKDIFNQISAIDSNILQPYFSSNSIVEAFENMPALNALDKFFRHAQAGAPRVFNPLGMNNMLFCQRRQTVYTQDKANAKIKISLVIIHSLKHHTQRIKVMLKDLMCSEESAMLEYELLCAGLTRDMANAKNTRVYWNPEITGGIVKTSLNSVVYLTDFTQEAMDKRFDINFTDWSAAKI